MSLATQIAAGILLAYAVIGGWQRFPAWRSRRGATAVSITVQSKDGILFLVETQLVVAPPELAFAAERTAAELDAHGEFRRFSSVRNPPTIASPQAPPKASWRASARVIRRGR